MSPAEDFFLDPALDVRPGFQLHGAGLDRGDATFNLHGPRRVSVRVRRTIKARQKFSGHLGLGHKTDLTLGFAAQQVATAASPASVSLVVTPCG